MVLNDTYSIAELVLHMKKSGEAGIQTGKGSGQPVICISTRWKEKGGKTYIRPGAGAEGKEGEWLKEGIKAGGKKDKKLLSKHEKWCRSGVRKDVNKSGE